MGQLIDNKGKMPFYSERIEEIPSATLTTEGEEYDPGEPFFLRVESTGRIDVAGNGMPAKDHLLVPFFEGDNAVLCSKVFGNTGATAAGVFALFLD